MKNREHVIREDKKAKETNNESLQRYVSAKRNKGEAAGGLNLNQMKRLIEEMNLIPLTSRKLQRHELISVMIKHDNEIKEYLANNPAFFSKKPTIKRTVA